MKILYFFVRMICHRMVIRVIDAVIIYSRLPFIQQTHSEGRMAKILIIGITQNSIWISARLLD